LREYGAITPRGILYRTESISFFTSDKILKPCHLKL
jgi:hypothetical protein